MNNEILEILEVEEMEEVVAPSAGSTVERAASSFWAVTTISDTWAGAAAASSAAAGAARDAARSAATPAVATRIDR